MRITKEEESSIENGEIFGSMSLSNCMESKCEPVPLLHVSRSSTIFVRYEDKSNCKKKHDDLS